MYKDSATIAALHNLCEYICYTYIMFVIPMVGIFIVLVNM